MRRLGSWAALIFLLNNWGLILQGIGSHWNIKQEAWHHHFSSIPVQRCCDSAFLVPSVFNIFLILMTWQGASQEPGPEFWLHQQPWLCDLAGISLNLHVLFCKVGGDTTPTIQVVYSSFPCSLSPGPALRAFYQIEVQTPAVPSSGEQTGFTLWASSAHQWSAGSTALRRMVRPAQNRWVKVPRLISNVCHRHRQGGERVCATYFSTLF